MKSEIRRVAFTCDFLRARFERGQFENFQYRNLDWLYAILGADQWKQRWGVEVSVVVPELEETQFRNAVANDAVFRAYKQCTEHVWPAVYDIEGVRPVFSAVFDRLSEYDLIIGFELSPTIKRNLDREGKRYISVHIHPVRFLRDICFFAVTNWPHAQSLFEKVEIHPTEVAIQARRWRALFSRRRDLALEVPQAIPLIVGQTHKDAAVINNGVFTTLASYGDQLAELLSPYSQVLFLGHPFESKNSASIEYLRVVQEKTVVSIDANGYAAIFSPAQIPLVVTISSSLGVEAASVGCETKFLLASPFEHLTTKGVDLPRGTMIGHALLADFFVETLLCGEFGVSTSPSHVREGNDVFFMGADYLRSCLESWSFEGLQHASNMGRIRKRIFPASSLTAEGIDSLVEEHGGQSLSGMTRAVTEARRHNNPVIEVFSKPCTARSDFCLNFSMPSVQYYLIDGFHAPEDWGVWSNGHEGCVQIPVGVPMSSAGMLAIEMSLLVVEALLPLAPVLKITIDDTEVAMVLFRASTGNRQQVRIVVAMTSPICQVHLTLTHTTDDINDRTLDARTLGFALCGLQCSVVEDVCREHENADEVDDIAIFGAVEGRPIFLPKTLTA